MLKNNVSKEQFIQNCQPLHWIEENYEKKKSAIGIQDKQ